MSNPAVAAALNNIPTIAWHLEAFSASGGKVYKVAVVDNVAIVSWGSVTSYSRQYKVHVLRSAMAARAFAAEQTGVKEAKGYRLVQNPYTSVTSQNAVEHLRTMSAHRGSSAFLGGFFGRE